jgi:phosphoribosylformimino-5-aminoimidazole carboxamide ribonucleotide (ProFAR) isomerase
MLAIPVIEVQSGRCVHTRSESHRSTVVADEPEAVVRQLVEQGAQHIQLVDVDAIRNRQPEHLSLVSRLKREFPQLKLQLTAGVSHSSDILIWLDSGADWVTVGGRLLRQEERLELILVELGERVIIGLDVRQSLWRQGYSPSSSKSFEQWIDAVQEEGVAALMFTEIPEAGHVNGHNLLAAAELAERISLPVIAHGGIVTKPDLMNLLKPDMQKLHGVTLGKPLFEGEFSFEEAQSLLTSLS